MIHAEILCEVVSFFALCDLDALLLATRQLFKHASKYAQKIRIWRFDSVQINFWDEMAMIKADEEPPIFFGRARNIPDILNIALRNSIIRRLHVFSQSQFTAISSLMPTTAALMVDTLHLCPVYFGGANDFADFVARFRKIKVV
jgi:hypothetical protein